MASRKTTTALLILVAGIFTNSLFAASTSTRALMDRYLSAYREYQTAIEKKAPLEELQKHLNTYISAKAEYEKVVNPGNTQVLADKANVPFRSEAPEQGTTPGTSSPDTPELSEPSAASCPADLKQTISHLWQEQNQKSADISMNELQSYISRNPGTPSASYAKYELARAYETIKNDKVRAAALYTEIANDASATILAPLARHRLTYLQAQTEQPKWKQYLSDKFTKMENTYTSYIRTSWLAFPVKITRFFDYLGKFGSFKKAQSNESDFQLRYEEIAAPFVGTVDEVFSEIDVSGESHDDEGLVRLLNKNTESWFARWKLLSEARESIDVQYFIVDTDVFGMALLGLLHAKAKEGVKIRFMTDSRGSNKITHWFLGKDYLEELAEFPNVEIKIFNSIRQNLVTLVTDIRRVMASNHDKIVVVDGKYAIVGGRNIANEYLADKEDDQTAWRDCDIVIDSPEVAGKLANAFAEEFSNMEAKLVRKDLINLSSKKEELETAYNAMNTYLSTGNLLPSGSAKSGTARSLKKFNEELKNYSHLKAYRNFSTFEDAHKCPIKIIDKNSLVGVRNDITGSIVRLIDASKKEIILQNPYVVLTPRAEAALKRAGKRGVSILFHTNSPQTSDSFPTEAVMMAEWRQMLTDMPTCHIYAQMGTGQLHAKTFVFDSRVGVVGTYNLDYVSEQINSEVIAAIHSDDFTTELRTGIMADIANTREYHLGTADSSEYGPEDVQGKKMWLIRTLSKIEWLRPLF
ncbi:MAG TPA: phosphatidylserine/phosphatidylglycerophosphate/cardiolipin synthase family protein [Candidatus Ozemobacteraceae bacterium]|nr:phosphatidylserine/phosphatidylglycerophosphate/cardiolipin synthase family protein [Candidatus Ozemobacteraceae bacterium]